MQNFCGTGCSGHRGPGFSFARIGQNSVPHVAACGNCKTQRSWKTNTFYKSTFPLVQKSNSGLTTQWKLGAHGGLCVCQNIQSSIGESQSTVGSIHYSLPQTLRPRVVRYFDFFSLTFLQTCTCIQENALFLFSFCNMKKLECGMVRLRCSRMFKYGIAKVCLLPDWHFYQQYFLAGRGKKRIIRQTCTYRFGNKYARPLQICVLSHNPGPRKRKCTRAGNLCTRD